MWAIVHTSRVSRTVFAPPTTNSSNDVIAPLAPSEVANRVAAFKDKKGGLPAETRDYVAAITGATAEDWAAGKSDDDLAHDGP